jgi:hypothetical protein
VRQYHTNHAVEGAHAQSSGWLSPGVFRYNDEATIAHYRTVASRFANKSHRYPRPHFFLELDKIADRLRSGAAARLLTEQLSKVGRRAAVTCNALFGLACFFRVD